MNANVARSLLDVLTGNFAETFTLNTLYDNFMSLLEGI